MPYRREEPWFTVYGQPTVRAGPYLQRRRLFGETCERLLRCSAANARVYFSDAKAGLDNREPLPQCVAEMVKAWKQDKEEGAIQAMRVLGRRAHFEAVASVWTDATIMRVAGYLGFDGIDFYIAPQLSLLKRMIENLTVRDGGEVIPTPREVVRFYELGRYVLMIHLKSKPQQSEAAIGRLWPDGSFTPETVPSGSPFMMRHFEPIDAVEESALRLKGLTLGEPVYRLFAQMAGASLLHYQGGPGGIALPGLAPVFDAHGLVLGRRLEFRYGSILPALGGIGRKRRRRRR